MSAPVQPVVIPGAGFSYPAAQIPSVAPVAAAPAPAPVVVPQPAPPAAPVITGPDVPAELQGKTVPEVMSIYAALRSEHLARFPTPPAPARELPAAHPQARQQPVAEPGSFWTQPEERIAAIVDERVNRAMAPATATANATAARSARDQVASRFGDQYLRMEHKVLEKLQNLNIELLADPNAWANAYYLAAGEAAVTGAPLPPVPPRAQPTVSTAPHANPTFLPTTSAIFTEPPRATTGVSAADSLSTEELTVAGKMGMSAEKYAAWKGGQARG